MSVEWGGQIISKIYPVIKDVYDENLLKKDTYPYLGGNAGETVENNLLERFVPSFFTTDLCEKNSLMGRISRFIFSFSERVGLNQYFTIFDRKSNLCNVVIKAERAWLGFIMDVHGRKNPQWNNEKSKTSLCKVIDPDNKLTDEEHKNHLNQLVIILSSYTLMKGKGFFAGMGTVPSWYFDQIFKS